MTTKMLETKIIKGVEITIEGYTASFCLFGETFTKKINDEMSIEKAHFFLLDRAQQTIKKVLAEKLPRVIVGKYSCVPISAYKEFVGYFGTSHVFFSPYLTEPFDTNDDRAVFI